jgi:hypothetical protein
MSAVVLIILVHSPLPWWILTPAAVAVVAVTVYIFQKWTTENKAESKVHELSCSRLRCQLLVNTIGNLKYWDGSCEETLRISAL